MPRLSHIVRASMGLAVLGISVLGCDLASEPLAPDGPLAPVAEMDPLLAELLGEVRVLDGGNPAEREVYTDAIRLMLDAPDPAAAPAPRWARALVATDTEEQVHP